jgi:two-component system, chemotaxis family, sensor kinase CheA
MFITVKRHEREKQELLGASKRLTDAIFKNSAQGLFLLDGKGKILPQVSRSLGVLFRRDDFTNLTFEKLLAPVVTAKTLTVARNHIAGLLSGAPHEFDAKTSPLRSMDVRHPKSDGSFDTAHYSFEFCPLEGPDDPQGWLVRVTDITTQAQSDHELEELRSQVRTQGELLRGVLQMGGARFGTFLQRADASIKAINIVLKKPAREEDAFRSKLEETLEEVDRIRREAAVFKLTALESSARLFEDALHDLRSRSSLSGSDFLPLAVKLDQLFGQFAQVKSLTQSAGPVREPDAASPGPAVTESGTQIIEAPKFTAQVTGQPVPGAHRTAPAGSLDSTLQAITEHVAQEQNKTVVLESRGLQWVPPRYQAAIKNVAVQLIRNAVMHGIEPTALRKAAGKTSYGTLRIEFKSHDDHFELLFEDDGCGLEPDRVRATAIERGVVSGEAAARMRDREAIKLIFKSGFTTLASSPTDKTHGTGMSLVRRYIHEAGGKIALASLPGHETRFKITLPPVMDTELALAASDARGA